MCWSYIGVNKNWDNRRPLQKISWTIFENEDFLDFAEKNQQRPPCKEACRDPGKETGELALWLELLPDQEDTKLLQYVPAV
jgi:hypothetical protein